MADPKADPNLFPVRPGGTRAPLYFIAAPGVNALGFVALSRKIHPDQPVYVVQPKRRGRTFPPEGRGPDGRDEYPIVAAEYLASIRTVQSEGPYFLAGMCDGAIIAFQMARLLEAEGQRVAILATLDTFPIENTMVYPILMATLFWRGWKRRSPEAKRALIAKKVTDLLSQGAAALRRVDPTAQTSPVSPKAGATSGEVSAEQRAAAQRAQWRKRLWPGPGFVPEVIKAPIAVLRTKSQPVWRIRDEALGWRGRTSGGVSVHVIPGEHENLFRAPHVESASATLNACLDAARNKP